MKRLASVVVLVLFLSGCASSQPKPTSTPTKTQTQAEIETEFLGIAKKSCDTAQTDDVIESVTSDGSKIVALSKDHAYKDYSAVYFDSKGTAQVIYELELIVCGPSYLISMQEEANHDNSGDYEHHVKLNSDGTYLWSQHLYGSDGKLAETLFTVSNGLITKAKTDAYDYEITYGPVTGSDLEAFKKAVDAELVKLNS